MSRRGKGQICHWCKRVLEAVTSGSRLAATRDHVQPKSKGGKATVWACWACNMLKGDMLEKEWIAFMDSNPKWWKSAPKPRVYRRKPPGDIILDTCNGKAMIGGSKGYPPCLKHFRNASQIKPQPAPI